MHGKRSVGDKTTKPRSGNQQPSGTGTHAQNAIEQETAEKDRKAQGIAGRNAAGDKPSR